MQPNTERPSAAAGTISLSMAGLAEQRRCGVGGWSVSPKPAASNGMTCPPGRKLRHQWDSDNPVTGA